MGYSNTIKKPVHVFWLKSPIARYGWGRLVAMMIALYRIPAKTKHWWIKVFWISLISAKWMTESFMGDTLSNLALKNGMSRNFVSSPFNLPSHWCLIIKQHHVDGHQISEASKMLQKVDKAKHLLYQDQVMASDMMVSLTGQRQ